MSMPGHIELDLLSKAFPSPDGTRLEVLDALSFSVERGDFVSIVGPSGCGKTTLLHLVAGLEKPSSGEIRVNGFGVGGAAVGLVFQQPRLLGWRTVARNVALPLEREKLSRSERTARVERILEVVRLSGYQAYYPRQLSGGMLQRVALARALVMEPEILLMDEPFRSLDALTAQKMREEVVRIWREAESTVLFVTHDVGEAVFLSRRVMVVSPKPARIVRTFPVEIGYPRDPDDDRLLRIEKELRRSLLGAASSSMLPGR